MMLNIFACPYLPSVFLLQWNLFKSPQFLFGCLITEFEFLYIHIFWIQVFYQLCKLKIFSLNVWHSSISISKRTRSWFWWSQFLICQFFLLRKTLLLPKLRNYSFIDFLYCFLYFSIVCFYLLSTLILTLV